MDGHPINPVNSQADKLSDRFEDRQGPLLRGVSRVDVGIVPSTRLNPETS